jgi:hypothetical protein
VRERSHEVYRFIFHPKSTHYCLESSGNEVNFSGAVYLLFFGVMVIVKGRKFSSLNF